MERPCEWASDWTNSRMSKQRNVIALPANTRSISMVLFILRFHCMLLRRHGSCIPFSLAVLCVLINCIDAANTVSVLFGASKCSVCEKEMIFRYHRSLDKTTLVRRQSWSIYVQHNNIRFTSRLYWLKLRWAKCISLWILYMFERVAMEVCELGLAFYWENQIQRISMLFMRCSFISTLKYSCNKSTSSFFINPLNKWQKWYLLLHSISN